MERVQNNFIRTGFNRCFSPNIESCQVLLGVPPIDILSMSINIKFLIKVKIANDLTAVHYSSVLRQKSVAKNEVYNEFRPEQIDKLNLLCKNDRRIGKVYFWERRS